MHIGITLAVCVAHHVDGNAVDENSEIGAVVGIEAAKKNLIRFAAAVMLADDQPRRKLHDVARRVRWTEFQIFLPAGLFRCRRGRLLPPHVNFDRFGGRLVRLSRRRIPKGDAGDRRNDKQPRWTPSSQALA